MPWIDHVSHVSGALTAWYPGISGGEAIADLRVGVVNPSAKLPITFAKTDADLFIPVMVGRPAKVAPQIAPSSANAIDTSR